MTYPSLKKAFSIHLGASILVFALLVALMIHVWFPGELFTMDGGWQGLKIIAPIDLVLGPALTLLFYRPEKKGLAFDISAILLVQTVALSYGVYAAYQQRTAAIVFAENRFETVSYTEFKAALKSIEAQSLIPKELSEFGSMPIVVYAEPFTADEFGEYLEGILNGLPELRERNDRYSAIVDARETIKEFRIDRPEDGTTVEVPAAGRPETVQPGTLSFPLKARYQNGTITFSSEDFRLLKIEPILD